MNATLICNPHSGSIWQPRKPLDRIRRWMSDDGLAVTFRETAGPGDATRLARAAAEAGESLVVAYGGDGTINEVVSGLSGRAATLGIIPGGTANVLARELHIPGNLHRAVRVLSSGHSVPISIGRAGSRYFHLVAGIGLDAAVIASMPILLKRSLGKTAFWIQGIRQLLQYRLTPFELHADGRILDATFAVISNARSYGGTLVITPDADVRSEWLDVCVFRAGSRSRFLLYLFAAMVGRHLDLPDVTCLKARRIAAVGDASIGVHVDGEPAGRLPMDFEIVPRHLNVMLPAA